MFKSYGSRYGTTFTSHHNQIVTIQVVLLVIVLHKAKGTPLTMSCDSEEGTTASHAY